MSVAAPSGRAARIAELVQRSRFEILPLDGIEERVLAVMPRDVTLTVTASPTKGLEPTLALTEALVGHGYTVVPHLSARLVADASEAAEMAERLRAVGVGDVFVVAGDPEEPKGDFEGALDLLEAFEELGEAAHQPGSGQVARAFSARTTSSDGEPEPGRRGTASRGTASPGSSAGARERGGRGWFSSREGSQSARACPGGRGFAPGVTPKACLRHDGRAGARGFVDGIREVPAAASCPCRSSARFPCCRQARRRRTRRSCCRVPRSRCCCTS